MLCTRAGSKLGTGWDVEGAAEPQVLGLPRSHPGGPTMHGQGGCQETRGRTSQCPCPTSALNWSRTDPHWASGDSNCPTPSQGQH